MNDLIKVNYNAEQPTVSGRELHEALEINTPYTQWFGRMTEFGFSENEDYTLVSQKCETNNPKNPITVRYDHQLTIPIFLPTTLRGGLFIINCSQKQLL